MLTKEHYAGKQKTIVLLCESDGSCPVEDFLNGLIPSDRKKVDTLFELMAETGLVKNTERFKKLEGSEGIFEFKSFQIRLLCFHTPDAKIVICRGVIKKRQKHAPADIGFAESCRARYYGELQ